jgi:hypothetical protein
MTLYNRQQNHLNKKNKGPFANALRKRPESFVWSVLTIVKTQEDLDSAEDAFILELTTLHPQGYNLKRGGRGGLLSEIARQKISLKLMGNTRRRGKKLTVENKRKISIALKGRVFSEETRKKMSQTAMGNTYGRGKKGWRRACSEKGS